MDMHVRRWRARSPGAWLARGLATGLLVVPAWAAAAACHGGRDPCTMDLGRVLAVLDQGDAGYHAESWMPEGWDGYHNADAAFRPSLKVEAGPGSDGFSWRPGLYGYVGGSGLAGHHMVEATFTFQGLSFQAKPGWRLQRLEFVLTGTASSSGNGSIEAWLPGTVADLGQGTWRAAGVLNPADAGTSRYGFRIGASYLPGDDGGGASDGAASMVIDSARFMAHVTAVPEPAAAASLLAGLGLLAATRRRRH